MMYDDDLQVCDTPADNTYWANNGKYQKLVDEVTKLIPTYGSCKDKGPALEALRVAINCYYDFWNNGLCNKYYEYSKVFGISGSLSVTDPYPVERKMDVFILAACKEQGVDCGSN